MLNLSQFRKYYSLLKRLWLITSLSFQVLFSLIIVYQTSFMNSSHTTHHSLLLHPLNVLSSQQSRKPFWHQSSSLLRTWSLWRDGHFTEAHKIASLISKRFESIGLLSCIANETLSQLTSKHYPVCDLSELRSLMTQCIRQCHRDQELLLLSQYYFIMIHDPNLYPLLGAFLNSEAQVRVVSHLEHGAPKTGFRLAAELIARDLSQTPRQQNGFKLITHGLSELNLWSAFRYFILSDDSTFTKDYLDFCLQSLLSSPSFRITLKHLTLALNADRPNLAYFLFLHHQERISTLLEQEQEEGELLWTALGLSLEKGLALELKLSMAKQLLDSTTLSFAHSLCSQEIFFSLSPNPIKACLLLHQLCELVKPHFSLLYASLRERQDTAIELCGLFLESVESPSNLRTILHEKDLEGREVIDLIKLHPSLLPKIESLIQREWQGPLDVLAPETLHLSTLYTITTQTPFSVLLLKGAYWRRFKQVATPLQFHFFRRSPLMKHLLLFFFTVGIACLLTFIKFEARDAMLVVFFVYQGVPLPQAQHAAYRAVKYMGLSIWLLGPLGSFYIVQDLVDLIIEQKERRRMRASCFELVLDLCVLTQIVLVYYSFDYSVLLAKKQSLLDYHRAVLQIRTDETVETFVVIFGSFIWIKVAYHLRLNSFFGPLITIFSHMAKDILQFGSLNLLLIFSFAFSGRILFSIPQFSTFYQSLMTLFSWMLGQFSFETMSEAGFRGQIFLGLFVFLGMVLVLNFLIAVISTTYSRLAEDKLALYLKITIMDTPRWEFHPSLNLFTFRVPLLNFFSLLMLPCSRKFSEKSKLRMEKAFYLPAYLLALGLISAVNIVSLPLSWMRVVKRGCVRGEVKSLLFGLLVFPFTACLMCVTDLIMASKWLWDSSSQEAIEKGKYPNKLQITPRTLKLLNSILSSHYQHSNRAVRLSQVVRLVRGELPFTCTYSDFADIALGRRTHETHQTQKEETVQFKKEEQNSKPVSLSWFSVPRQKKQQPHSSVSTSQFGRAKRFLFKNSYCSEEGECFIYPGLLGATLSQAEESLNRRRSANTGEKREKREQEDAVQNMTQELEAMQQGEWVRKENHLSEERAQGTSEILSFLQNKKGKKERDFSIILKKKQC